MEYLSECMLAAVTKRRNRKQGKMCDRATVISYISVFQALPQTPSLIPDISVAAINSETAAGNTALKDASVIPRPDQRSASLIGYLCKIKRQIPTRSPFAVTTPPVDADLLRLDPAALVGPAGTCFNVKNPPAEFLWRLEGGHWRRRLWPGPPSRTSRPRPPKSQSSPRPPSKTSLPLPPNRKSSPAPPSR
jgi:hypothetical protein